ncbi:MAG: flagellar biosynthetic protein FliO [Phycisphaerales bacterium]|nr:flagellar biosynthetic protein FliO [Phycisphaerales bacterium]
MRCKLGRMLPVVVGCLLAAPWANAGDPAHFMGPMPDTAPAQPLQLQPPVLEQVAAEPASPVNTGEASAEATRSPPRPDAASNQPANTGAPERPASELRTLGPAPRAAVDATGAAAGVAAKVDQSGAALNESSLGIGRTALALVGVVTLALLLAAAFRAIVARRGGIAMALGPGGRAPAGVVHVLARYPLQRGQLLVLMKVGPRVLLVCQSKAGRLSAAGMTTLAEFSDPDEVAQLVRLTADGSAESAVGKFNAVLERAAALPVPGIPSRPATRNTEFEPPARVVSSESGDRAEISGSADRLAGEQASRAIRRTTRSAGGFAARPEPSITYSSPDQPQTPHTHHVPHGMDGAEMLRQRLAKLRSGNARGGQA